MCSRVAVARFYAVLKRETHNYAPKASVQSFARVGDGRQELQGQGLL